MTEIAGWEGWVAHDKDSVKGQLKWGPYPVKSWEDNDIDIQVECCGICASDLHTLRSGWGKTPYPIVVGHEIVGKAVKVGSKAEGGIKVGDRVGVGAQADSCRKPECEECSGGQEQLCQIQKIDTFGSKHKDGSLSMGGYADYCRVPSHFVFKIPDGLSSNEAAPLLCGGITVYSPLKYFGAGPGKHVGVIGLGGLGHYAVLFARALGSKSVTVISRTNAKKQDALKMGADRFIATDEDKDWATENARSLDLIISTVSSPNMPFPDYLNLLRVDGTICQVGAPEDVIPSFNAFQLLLRRARVAGSPIGSPDEIREMLDVYHKQKVKGWIETRKFDDTNKTVMDMDKGQARYRFVLVNEKHGGKL